MPWTNSPVSTIGWALQSNLSTSGQAIARLFQNLNIDPSSFLSWYGYYSSEIPSPGGVITPSGAKGISDWLTTAPASQGQQQSQQQQAQQQQAQAGITGGYPSGVDPNVVKAIITAARDTGVDPRLAIAIAQKESGLDPNAIGDNGTSFGLFQLHIGGELTSAGLTPDQATSDPYTNARVALSHVAEVVKQHPDWDPGQVALAAQGADPAGGTYASDINNYMDQIETGQGNLGWVGQHPEVSNLTTQPKAQMGGTNTVPLPFPVDYYKNPSLSFGEQFGAETEDGVDYPMPEGTRLVTPVGGTVHLQDDGSRNWGKRVLVVAPNGWTFSIGHMMDFDVQEGQTVGPGDTLGLSGGGPQSSSPGNSTGPHIEVQFIDPAGRFQDPAPFLQQAFSGTSYGTWMGGLFLGSASVIGESQQLKRTPDGRVINLNTPEGQWYQAVDSIWRSTFGQSAPLQAALDFQNSGITTADQLHNAIDRLPSHIPGLTIGSYRSLSDTVNKQAMTSFGRPVPESLLSEFAQQGISTPGDIKLWFDTHASADVPPEEFKQIHDAASPYTMSLYGDVPHPSDVYNAWLQSGGSISGGVSSSGSSGGSYLATP